MKRKLTRWFLPSLLVIFLLLTFVTPVLAIGEPNDLSLDGVWVYRNCRETGDQLYLISYSINYTSLPSESVTDAYLCRLMNGATELRAVAPYAYHDDGYGTGVAAIYFDANDAPTWEGAYTMKLMGNPLLSWNASAPETSVSEFDLWQDNTLSVTHTVLSGRIVELATALETAWGEDMVNVADSGQQVLTTYALAYFINVVPYLGDVAPYVYAVGVPTGSGVIQPEIPEEIVRTDYADQLEAMVVGSMFDMTPIADILGIERGPFTAVLYYGFLIVVAILLARTGRSTRPMMLFSIPLVILGAFVGVPLIVTILAGLAAAFFTSYSIFYKPSNA